MLFSFVNLVIIIEDQLVIAALLNHFPDMDIKKKKKGSHWGKLRWLLTAKSISWWLYLLRYYQTHLALRISMLLLLLLLLSRFSHVQLCKTPWTAAHRVPLSTGFSRQEYWSGLPLPSPGISMLLLLSRISRVRLCGTP